MGGTRRPRLTPGTSLYEPGYICSRADCHCCDRLSLLSVALRTGADMNPTIPGHSGNNHYKLDGQFVVHGDWLGNATWCWATCLGVAMSMAGALSLAYNMGSTDTYKWAQKYYLGC